MATTEESARAEEAPTGPVHGGRLVARTLKERGVSHLFTSERRPPLLHLRRLQGRGDRGHRHPPRGSRPPGPPRAGRRRPARPASAALTAGPGVTNGMSAIAGAKFNRSPARRPRRPRAGDALGHRDPPGDRPPAVRQPARQAGRHRQGLRPTSPHATARAIDLAMRHPTGPVFRRLPARRRLLRGRGRGRRSRWSSARRWPRTSTRRASSARRRGAPGDHGRHRRLLGARRDLAPGPRREAQAPVFLNGMGRGCLPADHDLYFSRARGQRAEGGRRRARRRRPARLPPRLRRQLRRGHEDHLPRLQAPERAEAKPPARLQPHRRHRRDPHGAGARAATSPRPLRLARRPARDRGREARRRGAPSSTTTAPRFTPCASTRSSRRSCPRRDRHRRRRRLRLLRGQGHRHLRARHAGWTPAPSAASAPGPARRSAPSSRTPTSRSSSSSATAPSASQPWSSTRWPATTSPSSAIIGNNGIWALEHHPMKFLYGYSMAAELRPATRYDEVAGALGCRTDACRRACRAAGSF